MSINLLLKKIAIWLGAGALLIVVLAVALKSNERAGVDPSSSASVPGEGPEAVEARRVMRDAVEDIEHSGDVEPVLWEPDRELNLAPPPESGDGGPPRTVAGLPAIERSVELPVVDPATVPYDRNIGRIDPTVAGRLESSEPTAAGNPMFTPGDQTGIVDNDGPLSGRIPIPDPSGPDPADLSGSSMSDLGDTGGDGISDPMGPGRPIDPAFAATALPNFVLPGPDVTVEDPDLSAKKHKSDDAN